MIGAWAGANPRAAVGLLCLATWPLGFWWLGAVVALGVFVGPVAWDLVGWRARAWLVGGPATVLAAALVSPVLAGAVGVALVAAGAWAWLRAARWRRAYLPHYRRYVAPLHDALAPLFGVDPLDLSPAAWLDVPAGLLEGEGGVTITLPTAQVPSEKKQQEVLRVAVTKLGLGDCRHEWRLDGENRHLHISAARPKPKVPKRVPFDDEFRVLLQATELLQ